MEGGVLAHGSFLFKSPSPTLPAKGEEQEGFLLRSGSSPCALPTLRLCCPSCALPTLGPCGSWAELQIPGLPAPSPAPA